MGDNKENKRSKLGITEQMLVIVNKDWSRTYVANVNIVNIDEGIRRYSGKCELEKASILTAAFDKNQLSTNMDEMATIIEDHVPEEMSDADSDGAGTNYCLN